MRDSRNDSGKKVTLADIARASGVSVATVSLVLRNKSGVGDATRQRVYDAAASLGYIHAPANQAVSRRLPRDIGLIVKLHADEPPSANSFYGPVLAGIEGVCRHNGISLIFSNLPVDTGNHPLEMPRLITDPHADGLMLVGLYVDGAMVESLRALNVPVVFVDTYASQPAFDSVVTDNFAGGYEATSYLIDHGHERIAILGSQPDSYPSIRERREGYLRAMTDAGLTTITADSNLLPDEVPGVVRPLLEEGEVTAFFACNDDIAIAAIRTAEDMGLNVPDDLSVIGFDNIDLAKHMNPPLTTMRVDIMEMGRIAAQLLLNRFEHPEAGRVRSIICPGIVERGSVAPPRG